MRIVLISYHGLADYSIGLANALASSHQVMLVIPRQSVEPFRHKVHPDVQLLDMTFPRLRNPLNLVAAIRVFHAMRQFEPDVVHFQSGFIWFSFLLPWMKRWPLVTTIHDLRPHSGDTHSRRMQWFMPNKLAARYSDVLIAHSNFIRDQLIQKLNIAPERVYRTFSGDGFLYHDPVPANGRPAFDVLFFGRIMDYKGIRTLIDATARVVNVVPDYKACIAGEGRLSLEDDSSIDGSAHYDVYNYFIEPQLAAKLFQQSKIVVLPYNDASQSGVIPLAYSFARPVIATTVGGLPEIVEHQRTGLLIPPNDDAALADAVIRLLQDENLRQELGTNGHRKVQLEMSWIHAAKETVAVYKNAKRHHENENNE
ncbi:glycosyltransferase family 4 protein [candidate division KSB1 bacterium]|nr:glycosyltransferase family 4 protein [candidate division KSB1 bacterium]